MDSKCDVCHIHDQWNIWMCGWIFFPIEFNGKFIKLRNSYSIKMNTVQMIRAANFQVLFIE